MRKRDVFNTNEGRSKEFMTNGTGIEDAPKTLLAEEKTTRETNILPFIREDTDKPLLVSREPTGGGASLPEKIQEYRKNFLNHKTAIHREQTYIRYGIYRRFVRTLPLLGDGMIVLAFPDNVFDHHLEVHEGELDEMVCLSTQDLHQITEHLFIYPVLLFVTYLLYRVPKMRASRNRLRKDGALPPTQTGVRKSVRDTTYMETVLSVESKEHPDDISLLPDFAKMGIPENLGETLVGALPNSGVPGTDAIGTSVEETTGLRVSPVLKQFKQEDMENKDSLKGMGNASAYREMSLVRKMTGTRRQAYIGGSLYEVLIGILPVTASGISVSTFASNVLAEHMEKCWDIIDETCHQRSKEVMVWRDSSTRR